MNWPRARKRETRLRDSCIYEHLIYDRCDIVDQWKNKGLSINGTFGIEHSYKNKIGPFFILYTKITNGSES